MADTTFFCDWVPLKISAKHALGDPYEKKIIYKLLQNLKPPRSV